MEKININIPKGWNACTAMQLEYIADVISELIARQDRYHPFDMYDAKIAIFFLLADIRIIKGVDKSLPVKERFYTCTMKGGRKTPFELYLWQLNYWLTPKADTDDKNSAEYMAQGAGLLDWLDNKNGNYLTKFPYPEIGRKKYKSVFGRARDFKGPSPDLDGFSWAQYRFASDMMQNYVSLSNNLLRMRQMKGRFTAEQIAQQEESVESARAMFLAIIFNAKTKFIDSNTGMLKLDYHYEVDQCTVNAEYFRGYDDTQWQVILFWWTGIMHTLAKRYPHVFKEQPTRKNKKQKGPSTPLEIYTATTATMQKYAGLTEDQVNNQSYSLVLEHLERLSKENEEIEKIRHKK